MDNNTDDRAVQNARQVLTTFSSTLKKRNLYSGSHQIYQEALLFLKKAFDDFFDAFGSMKIHIHRDRITYQDQVVYQGSAEPGDNAFILFRDGILWLEFLPGIELWEIDTFLDVFSKYTKLEDDAEDDIVTVLWQYNLPSISYEAADAGLESQDDIDFKNFKCRPDPGSPDDAEQSAASPEQANEEKHGRFSEAIKHRPLSDNRDLWVLSQKEKEELRKMVAEEEKLDGTDHVIEVLIYIMEMQVQSDEDLGNLLEIMARELREVLVQGRYGYLANVLVHLKKYMAMQKNRDGFVSPLLENFFLSLSTESLLGGLRQTWTHIANAGATEIKDLKRLLLMLHKSSVFILGAMLDETDIPKIKRVLLEVIGVQGRRDFPLMEKLIQRSTPETVVDLIRVLYAINDDRVKYMFRALLNHPSEKVREEVLKTRLLENEETFDETFKLIDDPDENIRKMILFQMGRKRNRHVEDLLLAYLESREFTEKDQGLFFDVLRTLGRCGSEHALPYFNRQLFLFPALGILRTARGMHRQALMVALNELNTENAAFLAKRASRGFFYNLLRPSNLKKIKAEP